MPSEAPTVLTTHGTVRGTAVGGVHAFKGIPYAAPIAGPARFEAPGEPERWDGTRDATRFSPGVPQPAFVGAPTPLWAPGDGDDCLSVNVWTPDPGAGGLPVLVWLYGGAFIIGSSSQPDYDGAVLAAGGAVVVTLNYRVGLEGFGALPGRPANRWLRDQLAALRWVQDNIAAFGGDPGNVTVFGQSAGATSVVTLVAAEAGRGLFRRAIGQSVAGTVKTEAEALAVTGRIAAALGVPATAEGFAAVPAEAIHAVQGRPGEITPYGPVLDGELVLGLPWHHLRAEVDLVVGFTRDEFRLFAMLEGLTTADPAATAAGLGLPPSALAEYRAAHPGISDLDLHNLVLSDRIFRMPSLWCARHHPGRAFCYEFTWPSPAFGGALGACHGIEVGLTFGNLDGGMTDLLLGSPTPAEAVVLSKEIRRAWLAFATDGDPGWPEFGSAEGGVVGSAEGGVAGSAEGGVAGSAEGGVVGSGEGGLVRRWDVPIDVVADPEAVSRRIWEPFLG
ncbi:carboxylesterase/lipase family protein [Pseudofrankia inefficax]|uniref:Carboxylic ester hydrolase n=1 Tax=Pseudofrankia inefficax (strain DSM 45817 / CECT 9037 / DDB 130130 / EuI1c) TaxID=298654 RepID=E3J8B7_PSEI1|nr:carboxylesterase family protein [Pseudofrankia inefficax]ADP83310.1 Carboxylesterase type B [Pseudofrankia inefficax]